MTPANHPFDLTDRVALITGSTKGIGRSVAEMFCRHGARVTITSRNLAECRRVAADINACLGSERAWPHVLDFADPESISALVDATYAKWGRIDSLVANAYATALGYSAQTSPAEFVRLFNVNVVNNILLTERALPALIQCGAASIVYISSVAGMQPSPYVAAYGIAKRALLQVMENYAFELSQHNVCVNAVLPGPTRTPVMQAVWSDAAKLKSFVSRLPLKKLVEPDEVAAACLLLASAAGRSITGQSLVIDNGRTLRTIGAGGLPAGLQANTQEGN